MPILVDCALIHYQFETIHPFLDGNGRMGRLLITFYLCWKGVLHKPLLYLSYYFKKNRQEYYDRLNMVRETGDYEQWVDYFLKGVENISGAAMDTAGQILELQIPSPRSPSGSTYPTRQRPCLRDSWKKSVSSGKTRDGSMANVMCTMIT